MKICVIGNSHVAALRTAVGTAPARARHDIDFYACPGGMRQPQVDIVEGRLRPIDPPQGVLTTVVGAGEHGLRLSDHDAVVVSACGLFAARDHHILPDPTRHPCGSLSCVAWAAKPPATTRAVSAAVFEAVVDAYVRDHASVRLAVLVAAHFSGPVLIQPWPAPNRALRGDGAWFLNAWYGAAGPVAWNAFFRAQRSTLVAVVSALGPRVRFLDYPQPDVVADGFMDGRWCDPDPWHGNGDYGALVLDQIDAALR